MKIALLAWAVMVAVTIGLAVYRKVVAQHDDTYLCLGPGEQPLIPGQIAMAHRMERIDKWGKSLTVVSTIAGLALLVTFLYEQLVMRPF